ncbi:MAG: hypothetical protein N3D12_06665, partial [Candidatus Methanomethyliaceae archaeon]|nr:hypothetical protein [Candidatus Methanomethyliaceae archaeon]
MITLDLIEEARKKGACSDGINAARQFLNQDVDEFVKAYPSYALWAMHEGIIVLSPECLDYCAIYDPYYTLKWFAHLLSASRLEYCAFRSPIDAFRFAAHLLPQEILAKLAKINPYYALYYAAHLLPQEAFDRCLKQYPGCALKNAPERLSKE